jgi:hypothetical protein
VLTPWLFRPHSDHSLRRCILPLKSRYSIRIEQAELGSEQINPQESFGMKNLSRSFVFLAFFLSVSSASAGPLTWVLNDVQFADGATATGSFDYDADTGTCSNVNITTSAGAFAAGGTTYSDFEISSCSSTLIILGGVPYSFWELDLSFYPSPLTKLGGEVAVVGQELEIGNFDQRDIVAGKVVAPAAIAATVDIEPTFLHLNHDGSAAAVNGLNDTIPVVIFGASTLVGDPENLDMDLIDPSTVTFGPANASSPNLAQFAPEFGIDEDSDGLEDARFRFRMGDVGFNKNACTPDSAMLVGELTTGEVFAGSDTFTPDCNAVCHN